MQKTEMVQVKACDVTNCCYNTDKLCHTLGIMVGAHAECGSFTHGSQKCGFSELKAGVGTCLASDCMYNIRMECAAPNIDVMNHNLHADCKTFKPRK